MKIVAALKFTSKWLCIIFFMALIYLLFSIWFEGDRECITPQDIPNDSISVNLRDSALRPLRLLNEYYGKRDPELADICIEETIIPNEILILGTNSGEIFQGREGAKNLLQSDWKYWGLLELDVERTALNQVDSTLYFAICGQVKLDRFYFRIPIKTTGILVERNNQWFISKMQFVNNLNTNYLIFSWAAVIFLMASLLLFGLSSLLPMVIKNR